MSLTTTEKYRTGDWVTAPVDTGQMWLARIVGDGSHRYCITCHCDPVNPEHRLDGSLCCPGPWYSVELYDPHGWRQHSAATYAEHELAAVAMEDIVEHLGKPKRRVLQLDGWAHPHDEPDMWATVQQERRRTNTTARIQVDPEADSVYVLGLLEKLTDWYRREHEHLVDLGTGFRSPSPF